MQSFCVAASAALTYFRWPQRQSWALSVFFNFFNNNEWCFCIFYLVNNLFLHQSYLKSPLPVKLTWQKMQKIIFYYWTNSKILKVPSSALSPCACRIHSRLCPQFKHKIKHTHTQCTVHVYTIYIHTQYTPRVSLLITGAHGMAGSRSLSLRKRER